VWINDKKITSENNDPTKELYLRSVQKDQVKLLWKLSISKWKILSGLKSEELAPKINQDNQVEIEMTLKTNQTFILRTSEVVEGKAVMELIRRKAEEGKAQNSGNSKKPAAAADGGSETKTTR